MNLALSETLKTDFLTLRPIECLWTRLFLKQVQEEVPVIHMNCLASSANPEPVTDKEIRNAVKSLNRGKATDAFGSLRSIYTMEDEMSLIVANS